MILINDASAPIRIERLGPMSKARREASPNKFMEMGGMPDRVKTSREDCRRARPGFVEPIQNTKKKIQTLI